MSDQADICEPCKAGRHGLLSCISHHGYDCDCPCDEDGMRWEWAGEIRLPREGDYYLNTAISRVVCASFDFHPTANEQDRHEWNRFPIMRPL